MSKRVAIYPDGFAEGSLEWMQVAKKITDGLADSWFDRFDKLPISKALKESEIDYDAPSRLALDTTLVVGNGYKVIPEFSSTLNEKKMESVIFQNSELGKSLLTSLDQLGVKYQLETRMLIDDDRMIEFPPEVAMKIHSFWSTYFGNSFTQSAEIYRDEDGQEFCYWYASVLYGSRALAGHSYIELADDSSETPSHFEITISDEELARGVLTYGQWSSKINLPWLSKCLFYLGETPFPSSMMSMGRGVAFSGLDESALPIPYMRHTQHNEMHAHGVRRSKLSGSEPLFLPVVAPQQVQMGWLFSQKDFESHQTILTTITTALTKILSYLEDGYYNHGTPDSPWPFHGVLFSDFQLEVDAASAGLPNGYSQWMPSTAVFEAMENTRLNYESVNSPLRSPESKRDALIEIMEEGVGKPVVGSATNDVLFSYFLNEGNWDAIDWFANSLKNLEVVRESTNAISNWGISKYLQGDYQEAIKLFTEALGRSDKSAENEASFYLAKIYEIHGDMELASEYLQRCKLAGGYQARY